MSSTTRKRAVRAVAPVAGLLAAGLLVWQGSYAAFSATTTNEGDAWATGELSLENSGGDGNFAAVTTVPLFNEADIVPGDSGTACITVTSTGSSGGDLRFYASSLADSSAFDVDPANLQDRIRVTVTQVATTAPVGPTCAGFPSGGAVVLNAVPLSGLPTSFGLSGATEIPVAAAGSVAYQFDWEFVSGSGDDSLQGDDVVLDFNWELQS